MKSIVIYFSQTGNTEMIAREIQISIEQVAGQCDLVKIKDAHPHKLREYDLIGIGSSVIGMVEPVNVQAFIKDMRFVGGKHAFVFCTHACRGEYFPSSIVPKVKSRGMVYIGEFDSYANCYMGGGFEYFPTAGHPDDIDLQDAREFGIRMAGLSRKIYDGEAGLIPPDPVSPEPKIDEFMRQRQEITAKFNMRGSQEKEKPGTAGSGRAPGGPMMVYRKDRCTYPECRLCMENCPMDGIDLTMDPPVIAQPCMGCGFCRLICPTGALDNPMMSAGQRDPNMDNAAFQQDWDDFHLIPLAKAEAEGKFRRYVPLEKLGWEYRMAPVPDRHPKWIIGKGIQR